ncbi:MAG: ornithine carbamoyltransferase [Alphaproteobacteria bacterium]|nr:ornithine carbamoyltransferase [Alphaproteobacteria bacterium]
MTRAPAVRHFLDLTDFTGAELRDLIERAKTMKNARAGAPRGTPDRATPLKGRIVALIFEKQSTRTRLSFDVGIRQLGGETIVLNGYDLQLGRGETIADTARVLSRYVDAIVIRTAKHETLLELALNATVPVINGLTNLSHPCQVMADVMTFEEARGPIAGKNVAWIGSGTNVASSFIHAAARFGFNLRIACAAGEGPRPELIEWARANGAKVTLGENSEKIVAGAACVVTDTWVSVTEEGQIAADVVSSRHTKLAPYCVTPALMAKAAPNAVFLHCLPAHRGEEVAAEVIDGPQSLVWEEAENRLHVQKAILLNCLEG